MNYIWLDPLGHRTPFGYVGNPGMHPCIAAKKQRTNEVVDVY